MGELAAQFVEIHVLGYGELDQPSPLELQPETGATYGQPGNGGDDDHPGGDQPLSPSPEEVGIPFFQPREEAATHVHAHQALVVAQRRPPREHLEDHPRHDQGGEHRHDDTDRNRDPEAPHRPRGVEDEEDRRQESRDVGVGDGREGPLETRDESVADAGAGGVLLFGALVDEHVGVDGHADRKDETGDARQGEHGPHGDEGAQNKHDVDAEGDVG